MRDHYQDMYKFLKKYSPEPIDDMASSAVKDKKYKEELISYDKKLEKLFGPVWKEEYLRSCDAKRK